ncbi:acetyl-CoA carboxylase carboxyltransferase subunit alpha [bacterium]|nr:acetyl-CoA carboxylase carboxyltransferase subunit alpha [bacterium]
MNVLEFESHLHEMEENIEKFRIMSEKDNIDLNKQILDLEKRLKTEKEAVYSKLTPWQTVQIARHAQRPVLEDYINLIFTDFIELHGDRRFSDDRALIGGFATLGDQKLMLIGHNRGNNVTENIERNFGMALPDGYRKALRLMELAERFGLPIVTFIDTPGAYPGIHAEERGQAEAIARNLCEMAKLKVPIVCIVTGEGGSGGALGIGVGNVILMLKHSIYSVISPEGCASILWRDGAFAEQAAESMKITAQSLKKLGVVDEIVSEPLGGAHTNPVATAKSVRSAILKHLRKLNAMKADGLIENRFEKYAHLGVFTS